MNTSGHVNTRGVKIGAMLGDLWQSLFRAPATEKYPLERRAAPERFRGLVRFEPEKCTGCSMCTRDCPANALQLITIDKAKKQFALRYDVDRCTFCEQCVLTCKYGCLKMSNDQWELAALTKAPFTIYYGTAKPSSTAVGKSAETIPALS